MPESKNTIAATLNRQLDGARLRVLIAGAGIAGATLGALLRRRGEPAAIIERHGPEGDNGYMLGLLPLGGRVLNGLGLKDAYIAASQPMQDYVLHNRKGRVIQRFPLHDIIDRFGLYRGIERGAVLRLLRANAGDIRYGASIQAIAQEDTQTRVTFDDGSEAAFDLVVLADGVHSHSRGLILTDAEVTPHETGWGGFVVWTDTAKAEAQTYRELWASGWGMGLYPVKARSGMFLAGRAAEISAMDPFAYADRLLERPLPAPFADALRTIDRSAKAVYWPMSDIRSNVWARGRVVLLGDAAAGFLPTAGVGASMAMDSAAALADELARADRDHMAFALSLYEKRQRHRVELAQKNSRQLAKYMFVNTPAMTALRDQFMRFYSVDRMIADISKVMEGA
ncbi:NAD(P)/FAD-dependent oxidoreductase [Aquicoccus sp. G2-2]|uniref:FAD-dependent oxidoreductase n=1 Tax=Aquicoccus sp. G2-2 TaxID=3092120 RepID=UPI002ADF6DA1|nr:NAD(P)/FAD-dependent oxidoreductase [Aquicoccus sp. G2-2]MEA1113106.1 NAD(P)/FAD-dependent oxidoreductase [Aquicoccus sp. G2-2]